MSEKSLKELFPELEALGDESQRKIQEIYHRYQEIPFPLREDLVAYVREVNSLIMDFKRKAGKLRERRFH